MTGHKILFIVEGETEEPEFLKHFCENYFHENTVHIYSYKSSLHSLAHILEDYYPEFDEKDDIDITKVLKEKERNVEKYKKLGEDYNDIFLVFDFEPQEKNNPSFDIISRMLKYFNDSSDMGQMYINYPMLQSFKHLKSLPDDKFKNRIIDKIHWNKYKYIVDQESNYTDISKLTHPMIISIICHHMKKVNYLLNGKYEIPSQEEYEEFNLIRLFEIQQDNMNKGQLSVVNTSCFLAIEYHPTKFFKKITTHSNRYSM